MAKKMCPVYKKCDHSWDPMPIRTWCQECNSKCEIVKPKAKYKRVRAWGYVQRDGVIRVYPDKNCYHFIPCTILIDKKYLKEAKWK